uniref:Exoribonuclease phosphorolytic domain-containing protein n=1 Tax=Acrobeloides nanus TaxID=290746 RepID=A0A914CSF0_9BILA
YSASEKALVPIDLYHKPFSITFGFMKDISFPILDPTDRETLCLEGSLVIGCNKRGEVCNLFQSGRLLINHEMVLKCIARALSRCEHVTDLIVAVVERQKRSEMGVTSVPVEITNPNVPDHVPKVEEEEMSIG